jgi:hypothetical protein
MDRPNWWCYPELCSHGHLRAHGRITVGGTPFECPATRANAMSYETAAKASKLEAVISSAVDRPGQACRIDSSDCLVLAERLAMDCQALDDSTWPGRVATKD